MQPDTFQQLLTAYINGTLCGEELLLFRQILADKSKEVNVLAVLENKLLTTPSEQPYDPLQWNRMAKNIVSVDKPQSAEDSKPAIPFHRIHFLKRSWFRYAATVLILAALGFGVRGIYRRNKEADIVRRIEASQNNDAMPGGDKAVLTLADGTIIVLDSAANGQLAHQGNINVIKQRNGQLQFVIGQGNASLSAPAAQLNTVTTPRGGQYQIDLPDGTHIWLNAATSLHFPTVFTGSKRQVQLDGEAYFEVAKDAIHPFEVVAAATTVEVLGTHFNLNAYANEKAVTTTLLEGKVQVSTDSKSVSLLPGYASRIVNGTIHLNQHADTGEALAWKEGRFQFSGADIETIMRQISRWYGVEVNYLGEVPSAHITGEIPRTLTLRQVMEVLQESGIRVWLEDHNQLFITSGS